MGSDTFYKNKRWQFRSIGHRCQTYCDSRLLVSRTPHSDCSVPNIINSRIPWHVHPYWGLIHVANVFYVVLFSLSQFYHIRKEAVHSVAQ